MINYKKQLNKAQHEIVTQADGHSLVLAGAGSGKTRTLTYRVAYLLEKGVSPDSIILMTFTNKAANEMVERVKGLLGYDPYTLWAGTFHKVGNMVLRRYGNLLGYTPIFAILDMQDSKDLVRLCYKELNIETKSKNFPKPEVCQSMISYARNSGQSIDTWLCVKYNLPSVVLEKIVDVYRLYQKRKKELNAMDFDDLLVNWLVLLNDFPQVKNKLAKKCKYILVDEYQDTNHIQASVIKELSSKHKNILAVGDDSQSIYSFRAADISHILDFPKVFSNTDVYKLETNYRSSPEILELANQSIAYNTNQYFKELKSVQESGTKPLVIAANNVYEQSDFVIKRIQEILDAGDSLKDIAILFRAGHQSAELQLALTKHNIPFIVRSGQKYFEQAHIKDMLAILRIWSNFDDEISWKRFLKLLPGIGDKTAQSIYSKVKQSSSLSEVVSSNFSLSFKQQQSWDMVVDILAELQSISQSKEPDLAKGIRYIFDVFYKNHLQNTFDDAVARSDDISAFINFSTVYKDLEQLLADVTLDESHAKAGIDQDERDKLVLSTIHQAKGLEWDEVMIIGVREGSFPHFRSRESITELEEERRLFYVACTRAKKHLSILYPVRVQSYEYGEMYGDPSLFIQELDEDCFIQLPEHNHSNGSMLNRNVRWSSDGDDYFEDEFSDDEDVIIYD